MVCCVAAKVHDSVQADDLKYDEIPRAVQNCMSPQRPEVDLEDCTGQEDISRHPLPDCPLENEVSRQVEDVTREAVRLMTMLMMI